MERQRGYGPERWSGPIVRETVARLGAMVRDSRCEAAPSYHRLTVAPSAYSHTPGVRLGRMVRWLSLELDRSEVGDDSGLSGSLRVSNIAVE